ncbi:MAG: isoprenylcysteine carboxylmethyltransferase family protein [Verrucomicrobiota bacterium]|nr:isoprenylcysteine carboxylmethyltransferase family protein [Verrucomicrobiota bacterium]
MKIRKIAGVAAVCLLVPLVQPDWFWIGLSVSLAGELIQLWCFASLKKTQVLACQGPYALVRNPMYLGRYFIVLGVILLLGLPGIYAIVPYTVVYWFYMANRVKREEVALAKTLGADYNDYCKTVNRFLPSFKGVPLKSILFWRWDLLIGNHGLLNAIGLLAAFAVLYLLSTSVLTF